MYTLEFTIKYKDGVVHLRAFHTECGKPIHCASICNYLVYVEFESIYSHTLLNCCEQQTVCQSSNIHS